MLGSGPRSSSNETTSLWRLPGPGKTVVYDRYKLGPQREMASHCRRCACCCCKSYPDPEAKGTLLTIAAGYERLAEPRHGTRPTVEQPAGAVASRP